MQIRHNGSTTRSDLGTCISPVFQHHDQNFVCPYMKITCKFILCIYNLLAQQMS